MRRLRHILLNAATVGSVLLSLALSRFWVRSYWVSDALVWRHAVTPQDRTWYGRIELRKSIGTRRGGLLYETDDMIWLPEPETLHFDSVALTDAADDSNWEWAFCGLAHSHFGGGKISTPESDTFRIPLYPLVLLTAALPAARLAAWLRRGRRPPDACPNCGYDCRATPARCPECGKAIPCLNRVPPT